MATVIKVLNDEPTPPRRLRSSPSIWKRSV
jgi:hypothetical protein